MSCGLGAVILVFMLIKKDVEHREAVETGLLAADLAALAQTETTLAADLERIEAETAARARAVAETSERLHDAETGAAAARRQAAAERQCLAALEERVEKIDVKSTDDVLDTPGAGEETYLMGLRVEGRRIVFLVDTSASMTDRVLIDIITRKASGDAEKRRGPKWRRTLRTARWLMARVPKGSQAALIAFSDKAETLGGGWMDGRDGKALAGAFRSLEARVPQGPTNLQAALEAAAALNPTNVYLVTDGLPTAGTSRFDRLNPFSDCAALFGGGARISGACREKLFAHSIAHAPGGAKINVVLLPLEGDPRAAPLFWSWAANTGGLLISPAESWP